MVSPICRGEVYGKKDLAPNFAKQKETSSQGGNNDRREGRGDRPRGGFRNNKK